MPIENFGSSFWDNLNLNFWIKSFLSLFLIFYAIFALILLRQVQLMCKTLPTPIGPLLKFLAIIHLGVSVAILLLILGTL